MASGMILVSTYDNSAFMICTYVFSLVAFTHLSHSELWVIRNHLHGKDGHGEYLSQSYILSIWQKQLLERNPPRSEVLTRRKRAQDHSLWQYAV